MTRGCTANSPHSAQRLELVLAPLCLLTVLWVSNSGWAGWVFLGQRVTVAGGSVGTDAGSRLGPSHHVASILGGQPGAPASAFVFQEGVWELGDLTRKYCITSANFCGSK